MDTPQHCIPVAVYHMYAANTSGDCMKWKLIIVSPRTFPWISGICSGRLTQQHFIVIKYNTNQQSVVYLLWKHWGIACHWHCQYCESQMLLITLPSTLSWKSGVYSIILAQYHFIAIKSNTNQYVAFLLPKDWGISKLLILWKSEANYVTTISGAMTY